MNDPELPRPTPTAAPVERQIVDTLTSLLGDPNVSSLVQGAADGVSSLVNRPDVTSIVGSVVSVIGGSNGQAQTQPPEQASSTPEPEPSSTPAPTASEKASSGGSKPNVPAIVGGVVGGVVGLALLAALLFLCLWCRRRRRKQPKRDRDSLFENEGFVGAEGTPGLVDPYASSSPFSSAVTPSPPTTSSFGSPPHNRASIHTSSSSHDVYHTPSPETKVQPQMPPVPAPPLSNSHASIPTVATGTGTFGPRGSTDSDFWLQRSNTMTSTASRPLPIVPLSRNATVNRSQNDLHRAALHRSLTDLHRQSTLSHDPHAPLDLGRGNLTPYPEESPMGERPPHMVEHAVDAGGIGKKEVLPPMYNPAWYEQR